MPVKSSAIKRHGIDIFEGGVFVSTNVGADMQHYSDLLGISAQKIESLMAIADISDVPKLAAALNGAFQNASLDFIRSLNNMFDRSLQLRVLMLHQFHSIS